MGVKQSGSSRGVTRRQFLAGTVGAACAAGLEAEELEPTQSMSITSSSFSR